MVEIGHSNEPKSLRPVFGQNQHKLNAAGSEFYEIKEKIMSKYQETMLLNTVCFDINQSVSRLVPVVIVFVISLIMQSYLFLSTSLIQAHMIIMAQQYLFKKGI